MDTYESVYEYTNPCRASGDLRLLQSLRWDSERRVAEFTSLGAHDPDSFVRVSQGHWCAIVDSELSPSDIDVRETDYTLVTAPEATISARHLVRFTKDCLQSYGKYDPGSPFTCRTIWTYLLVSPAPFLVFSRYFNNGEVIIAQQVEHGVLGRTPPIPRLQSVCGYGGWQWVRLLDLAHRLTLDPAGLLNFYLDNDAAIFSAQWQDMDNWGDIPVVFHDPHSTPWSYRDGFFGCDDEECRPTDAFPPEHMFVPAEWAANVCALYFFGVRPRKMLE